MCILQEHKVMEQEAQKEQPEQKRPTSPKVSNCIHI